MKTLLRSAALALALVASAPAFAATGTIGFVRNGEKTTVVCPAKVSPPQRHSVLIQWKARNGSVYGATKVVQADRRVIVATTDLCKNTSSVTVTCRTTTGGRIVNVEGSTTYTPRVARFCK